MVLLAAEIEKQLQEMSVDNNRKDNNNNNRKINDRRKLENEEEDSVRDLVQDFQSQDILSQSSTSTPVQRKNNKNSKALTNKPMGVLPTVGAVNPVSNNTSSGRSR